MKRAHRIVAALLSVWGFVLLSSPPAFCEEIDVREMLILDSVARGGRVPVVVDPVEHSRITGAWRAPSAGDAVTAHDGREVRWRAARAGDDGWISGEALAGGYAFATVDSPVEQVMILEASGHGMVFVNGEPRTGDPYEYGFVRLPVLLKTGSNELLFTVARSRLRAKLTTPVKDVYFDNADVTAPDFIKGSDENWQPYSVVQVNATTQRAGSVLPLSVRKVRMSARWDGKSATARDDQTGVSFRVREPEQTYKRTFISDIDGSVQYYAVNPARGDSWSPALVLSLHGAGVEAINQADAYSSKSWCDIVCPTNRRPFGFDWEDWGRLDALEVLNRAQWKRALTTSYTDVYLTGHSMGGHGVWNIGSLYPDQFAALGPSAGWISFSTYATTHPATQQSTSVAEMMRRAAAPSDTSLVFSNLAQPGVYILHGANDDNVPADQARQMVEHLSKFHKDFVYHEQPGAGHWWENSDEPGAECVDWAPMFDFFVRHRLPQGRELRQIRFVTPSPGVSARCHWITIEAQEVRMHPSSIQIRVDPLKRRYVGTTTNVQRLSVDLIHLAGADPIEFELDGQKLSTVRFPKGACIWLERGADGWQVIDKPSLALKGPHRCGPFKDAFRNRMMFVYGTGGTPEENAWALAKARFDAETWWYRANGSVEVIPDTEFALRVDPDRNVILYGNADTLSCWDKLLGSSPVQLKRGSVTIGQRSEAGEDLACLFLRPRPGSAVASVAVIGGTGITGMRACDRLPVFLSGVAYPDCTVIAADALARGMDGVRCAGFFGSDWSVEKGEFVWGE